MTRTHTSFFSEGDLVQLRAEVERLTVDWNERARHVPDTRMRDRGNVRLSLLRQAVELLSEPAD